MSNSEDDLVLVEREGRVALVTLNRPAKLNALNSALIAAATQRLAAFRDGRQTSVIVLRGAGRAFSAGADVDELSRLDAQSARAFITRLHDLMELIRNLPQVVIAAVAGPCFGGACELAAACDMRIAAETARFGMPEIKVGMPSVIEAALLVPLMGFGRAADFVLSGDELDAQEAKQAGLVTRVVAAAELESETRALALRVAGYSGPALRLQKQLAREWLGAAFDRAIERGIEVFAEAFDSPNPSEAIAAFRERRPPAFTEL